MAERRQRAACSQFVEQPGDGCRPEYRASEVVFTTGHGLFSQMAVVLDMIRLRGVSSKRGASYAVVVANDLCGDAWVHTRAVRRHLVERMCDWSVHSVDVDAGRSDRLLHAASASLIAVRGQAPSLPRAAGSVEPIPAQRGTSRTIAVMCEGVRIPSSLQSWLLIDR
jgi:hypothetical protein